MNKPLLYTIIAVVIFVSGFLVAKKYYSNQTKTITEIQNHTITKISSLVWEDLHKKEVYLTPTDCKKFGLIHGFL